MSLVDSEHIEGTRIRRDCVYKLKDNKPSMIIWNREHSERVCEKCFRGAFPFEKKCPRCGGGLR